MSRSTPSLAGQVVFITGAARGIGEHTARLAVAAGAKVALVGLEQEMAAQIERTEAAKREAAPRSS